MKVKVVFCQNVVLFNGAIRINISYLIVSIGRIILEKMRLNYFSNWSCPLLKILIIRSYWHKIPKYAVFNSFASIFFLNQDFSHYLFIELRNIFLVYLQGFSSVKTKKSLWLDILQCHLLHRCITHSNSGYETNVSPLRTRRPCPCMLVFCNVTSGMHRYAVFEWSLGSTNFKQYLLF